MTTNLEEQALVPVAVKRNGFNENCRLPYGLTTDHLYNAMVDFVEFLGFINQQLYRYRWLIYRQAE